MNTQLSRFNILILLTLLLSTFLIGSCEKDEMESNSFDLKVFFQYEYKNWAWGYSHSGWFVDNKGNIRGYSMPETWKHGDSLGYIAYDSLMYNYNQTDTLLEQVDLDTLIMKSALIEGTINGELSKLDCHGADIGSMNFYCYYWDRKNKRFKRQLLSSSGDCDQINTSSEAVELTEFLIQIRKKFYWTD